MVVFFMSMLRSKINWVIVEAQPMDCRGEQKLGITISLGATSTNNRMSTNVSNEKLIEEADIALYRAKEGGRNRVETAAIK